MKVIVNLLKFIFIIILTICLIAISLIKIVSLTVLNKNYILQKLEETDFYSDTYKLVESNFENYIYQSGFDEDVLKNICTQEKVKKDINIIISNIYDGTEQNIDTTEIANNLNTNIDKLGIKNKQNENAINQFVVHICNEYTDTVLHTQYENKVNNVYQKVINILNKIYNILIIAIIIDLIAIIITNKKNVSKNIQSLGISLLASSIFEGLVCLIIKSKINIQGIKVFNDTFSKTLVTIIEEILQKINLISLTTCIIAIMFIIIYVLIMTNKKTKDKPIENEAK